MLEQLVVAIHGNNPQALEGIELEQMAIVADEVVCSAGQRGLENGTIFRVGDDFGARSYAERRALLENSALRERRELLRKVQIFDEHAHYFVEHIPDRVNAPSGSARRSDHPARGFSKECVCNMHVGIEEDFHRR
ncbi:MAG TPA: hypothetical protein VM008_14035 [Phycisphaerae bacterium]|nr:hypothetical protein [Phycisphaerae bacterium]